MEETLSSRIATAGFFLYLFLQANVALCETIISSEYFPIADGNTWTYAVTAPRGDYTDTITVLPGITLVNGVETKALQDSAGDIEYITSDKNGVKLYGFLVPSEGGSVNFAPPIVQGLGTMEIPFTANSAGTAEFILNGIGTYYLSYTYGSVFVKKEMLTVPAGAYETIRTDDTLRIFGDIAGQPFDVTDTWTTWNARYIGIVKESYTDSDGTEESVLISTNVSPPTAPGTTSLPWLQLLLD
jgi:hypothetical protein